VVGSTALTEREDAELVQLLLERTFDRLIPEIECYGGLLDKTMGDGLLALFGVPLTHEDDPFRAVRAGLAMQAALARLNQELAAEGRPQLAVRIGVEAGEVMVNESGVGGRARQVTGDAVNTAARLEHEAAPGTVLVGPQVHRATEGLVDYRARTPLRVKGKAEPVAAWEVVGVKGDRRLLRHGRVRSRLVGRENELARMARAFDRSLEGDAAVLVTVVGSAGVGKSRLVEELRHQAEDGADRARWREGFCLAYANAAYSALAEAVRAECGIFEDDPPELVSAKIGRRVRVLFGDEELRPHIETLAGLSAQRLAREDLFDAWRRFLEQTAASGPFVVVLEDVQWADDGLLDFAEHVAAWGGGRLLLVCVTRPELFERRPEWGAQARMHEVLHLEPLAPPETAALVEEVAATPLPDDLAHRIVERCEGNPFFAEEIVRMLVERSASLEPPGLAPPERVAAPSAVDADVPASIHALLAARLDGLPSDEKLLLQEAAVIGRTFPTSALVRLAGRDESDVATLLRELERREVLVRPERSVFSETTEFAFRHVLIRDVAYESVPKLLRAQKHVEVARWAEEQSGTRREDVVELLASHYLRAVRCLDDLGEAGPARTSLQTEAYRCTSAAAARALRLWQQREAVQWYRAALDLAGVLAIADRSLALLWEAYATACEGVEPYAVVENALSAALSIHAACGSEADRGRVEARLAHIAYQLGRERAVLERAEAALARLEPLGDSADLSLALAVLGQYHRRRGQWKRAEAHLQRSMDMAHRVGDPVMRIRAMVWLGSVLQGAEGERGVELLQDALDLARRSGDLSLLLRTTVELSEAFEQATGDYAKAEALLRDGIELARRSGSVGEAAWMESNLADYLFDVGRLDEQVEQLARNGLRAAAMLGEAPRVGYSLCAIAMLQTLRGDEKAAMSTLDQLRDVLEQCPDPFMHAWDAVARGLMAESQGRVEEAADILSARAESLGDTIQVWGGQNLLFESVRTLVRCRRRREAQIFRDKLEVMAARSVPASAFCEWASALLDQDDDSAARGLTRAASRFERLGRRIEVARCLRELARRQHAFERDVTGTGARGERMLEECGAMLLLRLPA
jgi:class 3 adenylate cyclase/tetratricopeptide (TPR) repeat protein